MVCSFLTVVRQESDAKRWQDQRVPGYINGYVRRFWQVCIGIWASAGWLADSRLYRLGKSSPSITAEAVLTGLVRTTVAHLRSPDEWSR